MYNLGRDAGYDKSSDRKFSVAVNGSIVLDSVDVMSEAGPARPYVVKTDVNVSGGSGITVAFGRIKGETMLSAIRIIKLD